MNESYEGLCSAAVITPRKEPVLEKKIGYRIYVGLYIEIGTVHSAEKRVRNEDSVWSIMMLRAGFMFHMWLY